mmetsp:Transcript_5499/g.14508  ORF Transcript_5499/g.14508 Transcript_5499/m.14508 type:complete len:80 (-) Transcript_5499:2055-2294(-)
MLAFRHKKPLQCVLLDKQLGPKVDAAKWGPAGREYVQKLDGMRERIRAGLEKVSESGAVSDWRRSDHASALRAPVFPVD